MSDAGRRGGHKSAAALLTAALVMSVSAPAARAQATTTAFDGIYAGVSAVNNSQRNTLSGGHGRSEGYAGSRGCRDLSRPARLAILRGEAQAKWGQYLLRGTVTPQGRLVMTTGYGQRFEGQIEGRDRVSGQLVGYCAYTLTWRKAD